MGITVILRFNLLLTLLAGQLLVGQSSIGSINGKPISEKVQSGSMKLAADMFVLQHGRELAGPSDQAEVDATFQRLRCTQLEVAIKSAARDVAKQQLGVVVTIQDLEMARQLYPTRNPENESAAITARATATLTALSAVYDRHQDPDQVYDQMLQGQIPKNMWLVHVHDARTPEGRTAVEKQLRQQLSVTPGTFKRPEIWQSSAQSLKLDEAVDDFLAARDPQFRTDLQHVKAKNPGRPTSRVLPQPGDPEAQYLALKRAEYWKSITGQLDVNLNDPSIASGCHLDSIGVRLAHQ